MNESPERDERHQARMLRKKAVMDERIASAPNECGLLLVLTGNGKGKSSSAFGMLARAMGHGMQCGVVQFIKGRNSTGEEIFFRRFPEQVRYHVMGEGFTWETQNKEKDREAAQQVWQEAKRMLASDQYDVILLDELTYMVAYHYIELDDVVNALTQRPSKQHVIITGRGCHRTLVELADTVSEIRNIKHAFDNGIKAQKGIDW